MDEQGLSVLSVSGLFSRAVFGASPSDGCGTMYIHEVYLHQVHLHQVYLHQVHLHQVYLHQVYLHQVYLHQRLKWSMVLRSFTSLALVPGGKKEGAVEDD